MTTVNGVDDIPVCLEATSVAISHSSILARTSCKKTLLVQILGKKNSLITLAGKIKVKSKMKKQYCHWKIFKFSLNLEAVYNMLPMQVGNFMDNLSAVQIATAKQTTLHDFI